MYRKQVRRRRAVLLLLVAASLTLLSLYYREGNAGPLHGVQDVVSTVFSPIESGVDRALKPVRDLVNWFHETFDARGEKDRKSTRLNSSHTVISYAVFCLKKKKRQFQSPCDHHSHPVAL